MLCVSTVFSLYFRMVYHGMVRVATLERVHAYVHIYTHTNQLRMCCMTFNGHLAYLCMMIYLCTYTVDRQQSPYYYPVYRVGSRTYRRELTYFYYYRAQKYSNCF